MMETLEDIRARDGNAAARTVSGAEIGRICSAQSGIGGIQGIRARLMTRVRGSDRT
jgi:hypothetical protein